MENPFWGITSESRAKRREYQEILDLYEEAMALDVPSRDTIGLFAATFFRTYHPNIAPTISATAVEVIQELYDNEFRQFFKIYDQRHNNVTDIICPEPDTDQWNWYKHNIQEYIRIYGTEYERRVQQTVLNILDAFVKGLPPFALVSQPTFFTTKLKDATDCEALAKGIYTALGTRDEKTKLGGFGLYSSAVWNYAYETGKTKTKGDGPAVDWFDTSPIKRLFEVQIPFSWPPESRFSGFWICAPQGRGKTNLLKHIVINDIMETANQKASVIIMDSKGDLIDAIRAVDWHGALTVLEPDEEYPLALNPLDLGASTTHTINFIEYVFSSLLDAKTTTLQSTLFRCVLLALRAVPNATMTTFRQLLQDGWRPFERYINTLDPEDSEFFTKGEFDSKTYVDTRNQLVWRIRDMTGRVTILRKMFNAPKTRVNMQELMDKPGITIINNSRAILGDEGVAFFSRFFIALIRAAADQRSHRKDSDKLPVYVTIDECHDVISTDPYIPKIIQECRSQKIALTLAHHELQQIKSEDVKGALGNCQIRMARPDEEAKELAPRLRTTAEQLQSLKVGQFATFVRDLTPKGIAVTVPLDAHEPVPDEHRMTPEKHAALKAEMRKRYSISPQRTPAAPAAAPDTITTTTSYTHNPRDDASPSTERWP